jgi:uncharacterized protein (TIGR03435 family)
MKGIVHERTLARRLVCVAVAPMIAYVLLLPGPQILAQAQAAKPFASINHKPEFDVASVKQNKSNNESTSNFPLDRSDTYSPNGGSFSATGQPLIAYLIFAYKVGVSETYGGLMRRLPAWAVTDKFDIQAKAGNQNPTKDEMRLMMQSLLEDRFKLVVHRETRQVPVFALTLVKPGKTGPQLKQHDPTSSCSTTPSKQSPAAPVASLVGLWPTQCRDGMEIWAPDAPRRQRSGGRDMSMDAIASWLTGTDEIDLQIVNHSDLTGTFDFIIEFEPEHPESVSAGNAPVEGPSFLDAMKDQLGLQLKKQMGSASFFIVDHVEYPSAN